MWAIVVFVDEDAVEAIPTIWISNEINGVAKAYWPPWRGKTLKKCIVECKEPDPNWSMCEIRVLGKRTYNDYEDASRQSRKGTYTSDICTTDSEAPRIRRPVIASTSEDSSSDGDIANVKLPLPPKKDVSSIRLKQTNSTKSTPLMKTKDLQQTEVPKMDTVGCSACVLNKREMEKLILTITKQYSLMYTKLQDIANDVARLAVNIEEKNNGFPEKSSALTYDFPLKTHDCMEAFEEFIKDDDNNKKLIQFIMKIGGTSAYDCIRRSLSQMITNKLANEYSWVGAKGKKPFGKLKLAKALIAGVQANPHTKNQTNQEVEQCIKTWLRHAKERGLKEKKEISFPLHKAVENKIFHKVKILLGRTNINVQDENQCTALHLACDQDNNEEILDLLLSCKEIDVTLKNKNEFTALHYLAFRGNLAGIYEILEKFPQINIDEVNDQKNTPLIMASKMNHVTVIKYLASKGANVRHANEKYFTALHYAANNGYHRCAEVILSLGANVNAKDDYGLTPLMKACKWGFYETCEILLKYGADVNSSTRDNLQTPLYLACFNDSDKVLQMLINHGTDVHFPGSFSCALFESAKRGSLKCAELLIKAGVVTTAKTQKGIGAIDLARKNGHHEIVNLLESLKL